MLLELKDKHTNELQLCLFELENQRGISHRLPKEYSTITEYSNALAAENCAMETQKHTLDKAIGSLEAELRSNRNEIEEYSLTLNRRNR